MNKSILRSLPPKQCERIASGKQVIILSKTKPKIETPFKCYIYCTQNEFIARKVNGEFWKAKRNCLIMPNDSVQWGGKVIGEFVCDRIEPIACHKSYNGVGFDYTYYTNSLDTLTNETQLTDYDMQQYLGHAEDGECVGYAWHISQLKIYDKPRELREFRKYGYENDLDAYSVAGGGVPIIFNSDSYKISRPPQSYCYVEDLNK